MYICLKNIYINLKLKYISLLIGSCDIKSLFYLIDDINSLFKVKFCGMLKR